VGQTTCCSGPDYHHGSEFIGSKFQHLIKQEYDIEAKPSSERNPQYNAIIERIHQTISNMLRTFEAENQPIDESDPWSGILSAAAWAVRSTCHTASQSTPGQLVFARDSIWDTAHVADWQCIKQRKQTLINKNNKKENQNKSITIIHHAIGDSILKIKAGALKMEQPREGPFNIIRAHANGVATMQKGPIEERLNMRQVTPYVEQTKIESPKPHLSKIASDASRCRRPRRPLVLPFWDPVLGVWRLPDRSLVI
jgi:hypothetical protein